MEGEAGACWGAGWIMEKGLAAGASGADLMENGEGCGAGAGSGVVKPDDAAAKGLMGNACAEGGVDSAAGWAIWNGEFAGA